MRGEEVIVRLQRHPALIEIAADHRTVSDRRNHVHEQVPFVVRSTVVVVVGEHRRTFHAAGVAVRHVACANPVLHLGPGRSRLPPALRVGAVHPDAGAMRVVLGDAVRAHTTIRQRTLDHRGVDGVTVVVNEHATIFERVLREIGGGAPQHSAVDVLVVVSLVRIIEHGAGPIHDECAAPTVMALRIVVRHPEAFACPSHTKLQMGAVRLAGHVEHARLTPMEQIVGFPDDEIRAGVVAPLVPAAAVASEHTQIGGDDIPRAGVGIADDMRIAHACGTEMRSQHRLSIVERHPTVRIVTVGYIHVNLLGVAVRILDEVDEQVTVVVGCVGHGPTLWL